MDIVAMFRVGLCGLAAASIVAATSAHAADLGGNCCADLEERINELRGEGVKGNIRVLLLWPSRHLLFSRGSFSLGLP